MGTMAAGNGSFFRVETSGARPQIALRNSVNVMLINNVKGNESIWTSSWHHFCWVDLNGAASIFNDGKVDSANVNYTPSGTVSPNVDTIGAAVAAGASLRHSTGSIAGVCMHCIVPSPSVIAQMANPQTMWDLYAPIRRWWALKAPAGGLMMLRANKHGNIGVGQLGGKQ